jgi:hypothetical protein
MYKRILAAIFVAGMLGASASSFADPPKPPKVCAPGQQGNPAPGFKPGSCK